MLVEMIEVDSLKKKTKRLRELFMIMKNYQTFLNIDQYYPIILKFTQLF